MREVTNTTKQGACSTEETISVALCTYNGEEYIEAQLASIFNQTYLPDEIIVCDDGSTDDTVKRLHRMAHLSPILLRIIEGQPHAGVTRNFERAIAACNGSIIVLADQDDIWREGKIQQILATFDAHPDCGYVFSDASLIDSEDNPLGASLWKTIGFTGSRRQLYETTDQLRVMLRGGNVVYGMSLAFRSRLRGLILPISSTTTDCTHDTWIATLLSAVGWRGVAISDALVDYRQHKKQVVGAGEFQATSWRAIKSTLASSKRPALTLADDYDALADRVRADGNHSSSITMLTEKALHLRQRRAVVGSFRLSRLPIVVGELLSGRYARYSTSWVSALRDLVE